MPTGILGITLNVGSGGVSLGADSDGTNYYQIVKIGYSTAGSTPTEVSTGNPLPVTFSGSPSVTVSSSALPAGASTASLQSSILTAIGAPLQAGGSVSVSNFPSVQTVTGTLTIAPSTTPTVVTVDGQVYDDDGIPYVNPNCPSADIATGDKQTAIINQLSQLIASQIISSGLVSVSNFPASQAVSVSNFPATQTVTGSVSTTPSTTPTFVLTDGQVYDDDGIPYVNPNCPSADIATGDKQTFIINLLTQLISSTIISSNTVLVSQNSSPWVDNITQFGSSPVVTGTGISGSGIPRVTVSSDSFPATQAVSGSVAITNTVATSSSTGAVEVAGNLQRTADLLEMIFGEIRVTNALLAQLGQPVQDGPDQLRTDIAITTLN